MCNQQIEGFKTLSTRQAEPTNECIRVNKVYDWVIITTDQVKEIPIPAESLTLIQAALDLGHQLLITGTINLPGDVTTSIVSVIRKTVIIDGKPVNVGCAQILKAVTLNVSVFDATVISIVPITTFTSTFQVLERAGLCFPVPFTTNNITLKVTSANALSLSDVPVNGNFIFEIGICQDLQVETEVKLEVLAKFCEPRDNTINCGSNILTCDKPTFPEQCPDIFPVG
ncbi:MAG: hypothetical protein LLG02_08840 [Pelosinus sp.]|nr:hypothetical protein [Pelosinus sp.]